MSANCDATAIAEEEQHVLGVKLQQLSGGEDTTENDSSTNDSLFNDFYGEFGEEVKDHNPNSNIQKHAAAAQAGTAAAELGAITAMEAIDDERNVDFVNHSTSIKSSSGSIINSTGDISIHGSANAPSQSSSGPIKWTNLKNAEQGESVEVFLQNADIGSVIFSIDAAVVKDAIFSAIAKFDKFPELQMRAIQLLQDCHMLTPGGIGITNLELNQRLEVLLRVLSSWLSRADIAVSMFELLAMLADRAAMIDHCCRVSDCELLQCMARALEMHSSCKEVQRAGLMLYESILRNATARSRKIFAEKMFRSVLDNLLLHSDDPFICYASFSILDSLAEAVSSTSSSSNALLAPFSDQLVGLTLSSIASLHSSSVVCKCIEFLEKLTSLSTQATTAAAVVNTASATSGPASTAGASGDASIDALAAVAGHSRGLWIFVDAVGILQAEEIAACISCLELMQKILTTAPLLLLALENIDNQGESRIEHLVEVEAEFRQKCDKYVVLLTESRVLIDERVVAYWLELSELIIAVLSELPRQQQHIDAANRIAARNHAISSGIDNSPYGIPYTSSSSYRISNYNSTTTAAARPKSTMGNNQLSPIPEERAAAAYSNNFNNNGRKSNNVSTGSSSLTRNNLNKLVDASGDNNDSTVCDETMSQSSETPSLISNLSKRWSFLSFTAPASGGTSPTAIGAALAHSFAAPSKSQVKDTITATVAGHEGKVMHKTSSFEDHRYMVDNPHLNSLKKMQAKRKSSTSYATTTAGTGGWYQQQQQSTMFYPHLSASATTPAACVESNGSMARSRSMPASQFPSPAELHQLHQEQQKQSYLFQHQQLQSSPYMSSAQQQHQQHDRPIYIPSARIPRSGPPLKPSERTMSKLIDQAKKGVTLVKDTSPLRSTIVSTTTDNAATTAVSATDTATDSGSGKNCISSGGNGSDTPRQRGYKGPIAPVRRANSVTSSGSFSPMGMNVNNMYGMMNSLSQQQQEAAASIATAPARENAKLRKQVKSLRMELRHMKKMQYLLLQRVDKLLQASNIDFEDVDVSLQQTADSSDDDESSTGSFDQQSQQQQQRQQRKEKIKHQPHCDVPSLTLQDSQRRFSNEFDTCDTGAPAISIRKYDGIADVDSADFNGMQLLPTADATATDPEASESLLLEQSIARRSSKIDISARPRTRSSRSADAAEESGNSSSRSSSKSPRSVGSALANAVKQSSEKGTPNPLQQRQLTRSNSTGSSNGALKPADDVSPAGFDSSSQINLSSELASPKKLPEVGCLRASSSSTSPSIVSLVFDSVDAVGSREVTAVLAAEDATIEEAASIAATAAATDEAAVVATDVTTNAAIVSTAAEKSVAADGCELLHHDLLGIVSDEATVLEGF